MTHGSQPERQLPAGEDGAALGELRGEARARLVRALAQVLFDEERQDQRARALRSLRP